MRHAEYCCVEDLRLGGSRNDVVHLDFVFENKDVVFCKFCRGHLDCFRSGYGGEGGGGDLGMENVA